MTIPINPLHSLLRPFALAVLAAAWAPAALAETRIYDFGDPLGPAPAIAGVATLTVSDITGGMEFTLDPLGLELLGPSPFVRSLAVNMKTPLTPTFSGSFITLSGFVGSMTLVTNPANSGGYTWDFGFNFPTSNSGGGQPRITDGEKIRWSVGGVGTAGLDDPAFLLHVQRTGPYGNDSMKLTSVLEQPGPTPVPEPETYALMLAGLGLVGLMARRRRS